MLEKKLHSSLDGSVVATVPPAGKRKGRIYQSVGKKVLEQLFPAFESNGPEVVVQLSWRGEASFKIYIHLELNIFAFSTSSFTYIPRILITNKILLAAKKTTKRSPNRFISK